MLSDILVCLPMKKRRDTMPRRQSIYMTLGAVSTRCELFSAPRKFWVVNRPSVALGRRVDCERIPHRRFTRMLSAIVALATALNRSLQRGRERNEQGSADKLWLDAT
jgi:hypothetical protein